MLFSQQIRTKSSAYKFVFKLQESGKLLIYTGNINGPKMLSCFTSRVIDKNLEKSSISLFIRSAVQLVSQIRVK